MLIRQKNWIKSNSKLIESKLETFEFCSLSIENQIRELERISERFIGINRETYRKFLIEQKLSKFAEFEIVSQSKNTIENKQNRMIILRILLEHLLNDTLILFFDESLINHFSFKKKVWLGVRKSQKFSVKTSFKSVKILACVSQFDFVSLQIFPKTTAEVIYNFLEKTIISTSQKYPKQKIALFLDNSSSNRSNLVQSLSQKFNVQIIYNAKSTPQMNLVEQYFEFLKRNIRKSFFKSDFSTTKEIVKKAKNFTPKILKCGFQKEIKNYFKILQDHDIY